MTALTAPSGIPAVTANSKPAFAGLLRSELIKLYSLRSTRISAVAVVLLVVAGMALRALSYAQIADPVAIGVSSMVAWRNVLDTGTTAGGLPVLVLAVLAVGAEYTNRTALMTFIAVPRRLAVLGAKALVILASIAALGAVGFALGTAAATPLMRTATLAGPSLDVLGTAVAGVLLMLVYAVVAIAVATLTRSTAAGITIMLALLLVLPTGAALLGAVTRIDLTPFVLSYAAGVTTAAIHEPLVLHELGRALPVTLAWLVLPAAAAAAALLRRDV